MSIGKIGVNPAHRKWCQDFMTEQNKSTRMVRDYLRGSRVFNPFSTSKKIDNILKRYEKSFWG